MSSSHSWPLCKYRNMFGKPGEGVHAYRLFGVAIVDVVMTLAIALLVARFALRWPIASWRTLALVAAFFALGVVAHRVFCVRTAVDRALFGNHGDLF